MKRLLLLVLVCLPVAATMAFAQNPCLTGCFNYQAVIRNADGSVLQLQSVELRISLMTSQNGQASWIETHNVTTDMFGTFGIQVGGGTRVGGEATTFAAVEFEASHHWMRVEFREGSVWQQLSYNAMPSVPYAMVAANASGNETFDRNFAIIYEMLEDMQVTVNTELDEMASTLAAFSQQIASLSGQVSSANSQIASLNSQIAYLQSRVVPPGTIIPFGGPGIPDGWLLCDGSQVSSSQYPALFAAIGTAWGGNSTNFRVPDLRGVFIRGIDTRTASSTTMDPDGSSRTALYSGGNTGRNVGSYQGDKIRNISGVVGNHVIFKDTSGGQTPYYKSGVFNNMPQVNVSKNAIGNSSSGYGAEMGLGFDANAGNSVDNPMAGFANGGDIRPKNVYVNYIIKY